MAKYKFAGKCNVAMNHIGNLINGFRKNMNMTRADLAKDICTEKYIYLIEKGQRTPSSDILRLISDRLRVDIFSYFQYLDCIDPIKVHAIMKELQLCHRNTDFSATKKLVKIAEKIPDFKQEPWIFEVEANKIGYKIFNENKYEEAINDINYILDGMELKYLNSIHVVNIYVLLSTCYQITGDFASAKDVALKAYEISSNKNNFVGYAQYIVTAKINVLTLYYLSGEFDKAINIGEELLKYNNRESMSLRNHFIFAFLAFSYYKTKRYDEAFSYFKKSLLILLIDYQPLDLHHIAAQDVFNSMLNDERISRELVRELNELYGITT